MKAYDPTPIIHLRNAHAGALKDCTECAEIKAKFPGTTWSATP